MQFSKEEQRLLSEDASDLFFRYKEITDAYRFAGSFDLNACAVLTALSAAISQAIDDLVKKGHEPEATLVVFGMITEYLEKTRTTGIYER